MGRTDRVAMARPVIAPPTRASRLQWPFEVVRQIWTSAVADEDAIRFNLRLLATLTALFSLPDVVQGVVDVAGTVSIGLRFYGSYVLALAAVEMAGAALLACRRRAGRWFILAAACGFYLEAGLGLAHFEKGLLAATVFAVCVPAEAWVIWFMTHPYVKAYLRSKFA